MQNNSFFRLFDSVRVVTGYKVSLIYDLQKSSYIEVPNLIAEILLENQKRKWSVSRLKKAYNNQYDEGIDAFFYFLELKGKGLFYQKIDFFDDIKINFKHEHEFSNAIIEVSPINEKKLKYILSEIEYAGVPVIEVRIVDSVSSSINKVLNCLENNNFRGVSLIIPYIEGSEINDQIKKYIEYKNIDKIIMYGVPKREIRKIKVNLTDVFQITSEGITNTKELKKSTQTFSINTCFYAESVKYNAGLNGKICIDQFGNVKNYLTHECVYGNINDKSLVSIVEKKEFKYKWLITKDKLEVCNKCQYRYMCNDTDDVVKKSNKFFKKNACNYDPYNDEWT